MRRSRMVSLAVILTGLAVAGPQAAAEDAILTLPEAIAIAEHDNPDLSAASAFARAARARVEEAEAGHVPTVDLAVTYSRTTNPVYVFGNLLGQEAFGAANFDPAFLNEPDALDNWNSGVSIRLPLYAGGRIGAGTDAARAASEAAGADLERARQEVVRAVVVAYTGVVLADAHLDVARGALDVARENVDLVRDLHEMGMVVRSDLLQAEVRFAEVEDMLARAEAATHVARAGLNVALGKDLGQDVRVAALDPDVERPAEPVESLVAEARGSRADVRASRARARAAERTARAARGSRLPEIGLEGRYEANAEDFVGADGTNWSLFAAARWTVFEGAAGPARVRRARAEHEAAEQALRSVGDRVELEVRTAYHELVAAGAGLAAAERAVGMAEESLRIVRDRYQEGMTTLVELLDAENALTRARVRAVSEERNLRLARVALDLATGRL